VAVSTGSATAKPDGETIKRERVSGTARRDSDPSERTEQAASAREFRRADGVNNPFGRMLMAVADRSLGAMIDLVTENVRFPGSVASVLHTSTLMVAKLTMDM
jgi:hypothetical protein